MWETTQVQKGKSCGLIYFHGGRPRDTKPSTTRTAHIYFVDKWSSCRQYLPATKSVKVLVADKSDLALALTYAGGCVARGWVRLDVTRVYWHLCQRGAVVGRDGEVSQRQQSAGLHSGACVALLNFAVQLQFRGVCSERGTATTSTTNKSRGDEKW